MSATGPASAVGACSACYAARRRYRRGRRPSSTGYRGDRRRMPPPGELLEPRTTIPPRARGVARAGERHRGGHVGLSRSRRLSPARRLRHRRALCALELPDALLRAMRAAVEGRGARGREPRTIGIAEVRANRVPEEHRAQFDELLGEARMTYRVRDERGVFSDIWASGLMRRAVLAAGRRLAAAGGSTRPSTSIDAGSTRCSALLSGTGGPSADELAERFRVRGRHRSAKEAPAVSRRSAARRRPIPRSLPPAPARIMQRDRHHLARRVFGSLRGAARRADSCAGWRRAAASTRALCAGVSPGPPSSAASCREMSSSPSRRARPSTSCCRCSGRS